MLDDEALILIAHSDWRTLMALYTLLDAEGHFAAPCFSKGDLLKYCAKYQPELVLTSDRLADDEGSRLIEEIRERAPNTRIVVLPEGLRRMPGSPLLDPQHRREILRAADTPFVPPDPLPLNGR